MAFATANSLFKSCASGQTTNSSYDFTTSDITFAVPVCRCRLAKKSFLIWSLYLFVSINLYIVANCRLFYAYCHCALQLSPLWIKNFITHVTEHNVIWSFLVNSWSTADNVHLKMCFISTVDVMWHHMWHFLSKVMVLISPVLELLKKTVKFRNFHFWSWKWNSRTLTFWLKLVNNTC